MFWAVVQTTGVVLPRLSALQVHPPPPPLPPALRYYTSPAGGCQLVATGAARRRTCWAPASVCSGGSSCGAPRPPPCTASGPSTANRQHPHSRPRPLQCQASLDFSPNYGGKEGGGRGKRVRDTPWPGPPCPSSRTRRWWAPRWTCLSWCERRPCAACLEIPTNQAADNEQTVTGLTRLVFTLASSTVHQNKFCSIYSRVQCTILHHIDCLPRLRRMKMHLMAP